MKRYVISYENDRGEKLTTTVNSSASEWFVLESFLSHRYNIKVNSIVICNED